MMMKWIPAFTLLLFAALTIGCSASHPAFNPRKKYAPAQLQRDYTLFRNILEESHPSLYWFTPRESMNNYFDAGYRQLNDSMTEPQFRNVLSFVANKIRCGHTSVLFSKSYSDYLDTVHLKIFPLSVKAWPDSLVVASNLNRKDSVLRRGTLITAINGRPAHQLVDTFFNYVPGDGYAATGKYQALSNRGMFGSLYRNVFGLTDSFTVRYLDRNNVEQQTVIPIYDVKADTLTEKVKEAIKKPGREEPRRIVISGARFIQIDTTLSSGYMTVNTFSRGNGLRPFFRKAFRELKRHHIQHLVVDVRANGGGDAGISTLLTRYLADKKFKLADSLYTLRRSSRYSKYIQLQKFYWALELFVTHKKRDGLYHFGYFERHYFSPKKKNHYNGNVYLLTGGNSFSATSIFVKKLKGQQHVKIIGEETGGGAYGNTAWMIPDVTLPNTKVRFRLPKFRLVMDAAEVARGRGVMPDVQVAATQEQIRLGIDPKVEYVRQIIMRKMILAQQ